MNIRTDLAMESREIYKRKNVSEELKGVTHNQHKKEDVLITTVEITDNDASGKLGKPIGKYVTLESERLKTLDPDFSKKVSYVLKDELEKLIHIDKDDNILVVGLGNRDITPDALGPETVSGIMVTRHLKQYMPELTDDDIRSVSALSPGVLGITGVETIDIVKGVTEKIKPSLVVVVDALASANPARISSVIQITDTGINPGSGIGNNREGLNKDTLGVPVIAIGVPTVVDAISIAISLTENIFEESKITKEKIKQVVDDENKELIVTPKEIDSIINHLSKVISNGINLALHKNIDLEYIESFTF